MKELKELNSVYKGDYIKKLVENDTETAGYVEHILENVIEAED